MQFDLLQDWFKALTDLIGREQAVAVLQNLALWGMLGGILGLGLSLACYRGFRRVCWYWATSTAGRWAQRGALVFVTLLNIALLGLVGVLESIHRQTPAIVTRSTAASPPLRGLIDELSDVLFQLDRAARGRATASIPSENSLKEFKAGKLELDVPALLQHIDALSDRLLQELVDDLESRALAALPDLGNGLAGNMARKIIREFGAALLVREASNLAREKHVDHLYHAVRQQLLAEAARTGHPSTIGRADLSAFLLREGIIPAVVTPVQKFVRQQQLLYVVLALTFCFVPAMVCRVCRPRTLPATPATPAPLRDHEKQ